ncbi:hypothetical protein YC2023_009753 [Brassica napus]
MILFKLRVPDRIGYYYPVSEQVSDYRMQILPNKITKSENLAKNVFFFNIARFLKLNMEILLHFLVLPNFCHFKNMKINIYASCGFLKSSMNNGWGFLVDEEKRGRLLTLDTGSSFENLKVMVCEDFGIDVNMVNIELSYLPSDLISSIYSPPVIITNDRQVRNFLTYVKNKASTQFCVSTQAPNIAEEGIESPNREEEPMESDDSSDMESDDAADMDSEEDVEVPDSEDDKKCDKEKINEDSVRFSLVDVVKKGQSFSSKTLLKAAFEICAMKHNFDYVVARSDKKMWYIRCSDDDCSWRVCAEGLTGSSYFIIKKYVPDHSCAASNRKGSVRTASPKTVGTMIMHKYETAKEGLISNDIIQYMRMVYGVEISYSLAWDAREYAINAMKGIPEKGYKKIPKYLHMMKEANPGSHTFYETDTKGRFIFLFISFGQSVRGFYDAI